MKTKKTLLTSLFAIICLFMISFSCSNTDSTETESMDAAVEEMESIMEMEAPMDSLPPLDSSATARPELENL